MENLSAGVVVHAADTRIILSNSAASRLLGLSADQLQGRTAMDPAWHFLDADGSVMALEDYPVNRVVASGDAFDGLVAGVVRPERQPSPSGCCATRTRPAAAATSSSRSSSRSSTSPP